MKIDDNNELLWHSSCLQIWIGSKDSYFLLGHSLTSLALPLCVSWWHEHKILSFGFLFFHFSFQWRGM